MTTLYTPGSCGVFAVVGWETSRRQDFVHVPICHIKTGKDSTLSPPKQSIILLAARPRSFHSFVFAFDSARVNGNGSDTSRSPTYLILFLYYVRIIVMAVFRFASAFLFSTNIPDSSLFGDNSIKGGRESDWLSASIGVDTLLLQAPLGSGQKQRVAATGKQKRHQQRQRNWKAAEASTIIHSTVSRPTLVYTRADYSINGRLSPKSIPSFTRSRPPNYIIVGRHDLKRQEVEMM